MNRDNIRNMLENAHIIQNEETYSQFAGLEYNPEIIERVSRINIQCCQLFMKSYDSPRELFLASLEILAEDGTKSLEQELHETRNAGIILYLLREALQKYNIFTKEDWYFRWEKPG